MAFIFFHQTRPPESHNQHKHTIQQVASEPSFIFVDFVVESCQSCCLYVVLPWVGTVLYTIGYSSFLLYPKKNGQSIMSHFFVSCFIYQYLAYGLCNIFLPFSVIFMVYMRSIIWSHMLVTIMVVCHQTWSV